jgi:hypothetical protein
MKYFITTENGHVEDRNGERIYFSTIKGAETYVNYYHEDWCGSEDQTYLIGTDDGIVWNTVKTIQL